MTRFEEAEIMRCIPAAQEPINWQPGDWAWFNHADGSRLVQLKERCDQCGKRGWNMYDTTYAYEAMLTIPTRAQLAREIGKDKDGKPILAWARERDEETSCVMYSDKLEYDDGGLIRYVVRNEHVRDSHIPIVTQSQIARHYGGVFPPKE